MIHCTSADNAFLSRNIQPNGSHVHHSPSIHRTRTVQRRSRASYDQETVWQVSRGSGNRSCSCCHPPQTRRVLACGRSHWLVGVTSHTLSVIGKPMMKLQLHVWDNKYIFTHYIKHKPSAQLRWCCSVTKKQTIFPNSPYVAWECYASWHTWGKTRKDKALVKANTPADMGTSTKSVSHTFQTLYRADNGHVMETWGLEEAVAGLFPLLAWLLLQLLPLLLRKTLHHLVSQP